MQSRVGQPYVPATFSPTWRRCTRSIRIAGSGPAASKSCRSPRNRRAGRAGGVDRRGHPGPGRRDHRHRQRSHRDVRHPGGDHAAARNAARRRDARGKREPSAADGRVQPGPHPGRTQARRRDGGRSGDPRRGSARRRRSAAAAVSRSSRSPGRQADDTLEDFLDFSPRAFFEIGRRNLGGRNRAVNFFSRISFNRPTDETAGTGLGFGEYRVTGTFRERHAFRTDTDLLVAIHGRAGASLDVRLRAADPTPKRSAVSRRRSASSDAMRSSSRTC